MIVAVTGGIGSGKSVVCRILSCLGYHVYDCDSRARMIMDASPLIKRDIAEHITAAALMPDGTLDRQAIAAVVFADPDKLAVLNSIVHSAVSADIKRWAHKITELDASAPRPILFVETAILYQSGLDRMVDRVWEVVAPLPLRIDRVCRRNGFTPEQVRARIASQAYEPETPHPYVSFIINDDRHSLLMQINRELS